MSTENNSHQRIVRAAIAMAQGLDIEVTAEGVETVRQLGVFEEAAIATWRKAS